MSKSSCNQTINGILLVNKNTGLSSNAVLQKAKHLYRAKKAGHSGSLDPLATGMLVVCFGEATKFCQYLLDADKTYEATGTLGIKTNTADADGETIATCPVFDVSREQLQSAIDSYCGVIQQTPSMFSALKHKGAPLYKYARQGIEIERKAREVHIKSIELLAFDGLSFTISVTCSKGTYIRNLVEDIGEHLGVYAHVSALHRTYTAGFQQHKMVSIAELETMNEADLSQCLLPMQTAIEHLPALALQEDEVQFLRQGKWITPQSIPPQSDVFRLLDEQANFIGLGEIGENGVLKVRRLLAF